jgi:hypothetical protein
MIEFPFDVFKEFVNELEIPVFFLKPTAAETKYDTPQVTDSPKTEAEQSSSIYRTVTTRESFRPKPPSRIPPPPPFKSTETQPSDSETT